jgi:hypothetical protein
MFVNFWRMTFAITALSWIITGGLVLGLRLLPAPPDTSLLERNPCALPCFFGVTPGVTTRDQAEELLSESVGVTRVSDTLLTFPLMDNSGRAALVSILSDANRLVESVRMSSIDFDPDLEQFGDLLLTGQTPVQVFRTCADMDHVRFLMTFGAGESLLIELYPNGKLTPTTPITLVDISRPGQRSLTDARSSFGCSVETHWYGFAPLWKYFRTEVS